MAYDGRLVDEMAAELLGPPATAAPQPAITPVTSATPTSPFTAPVSSLPTVFPVRKPIGDEDSWFKGNPHVAGMADFESDTVVLNPYSTLNETEKSAVVKNETARLAMRKNNLVPDFKLTPEQERAFEKYGGGDETAKRETIVGRIISGDPSALNVTPEQRAFAERVSMALSPTPSQVSPMSPSPPTFKASQIDALAEQLFGPAPELHTTRRTASRGLQGQSLSQSPPLDLSSHISSMAQKYGLDENIFMRQLKQESGFNQNAVSPKGARGIGQFMPGTWRDVSAQTGRANINDPYDQIENAAFYLRSNLDQFGSYPLALAAYNAGPEAVKKYGGVPPYSETIGYVRNIMQGGGGGSERLGRGGGLAGEGLLGIPSFTANAPPASLETRRRALGLIGMQTPEDIAAQKRREAWESAVDDMATELLGPPGTAGADSGKGGSLFGDIMSGMLAGGPDAAETYLRAGRVMGVDTSSLLSDLEEKRKGWTLDKPSKAAQEGGYRKWAHEGARSFSHSVSTRIPATVAGALFGGGAGALAGYVTSGAALFGLAEYDQFMEDAEKLGIPREEAYDEAVVAAIAEGGFELASDLLEARMLKLFGGNLAEPVKGLIRRYATNVLKIAPVEIATEAPTAAVQAAARESAGMPTESPGQAALESVGPTAAASLFFAGLGTAAQSRQRPTETPPPTETDDTGQPGATPPSGQEPNAAPPQPPPSRTYLQDIDKQPLPTTRLDLEAEYQYLEGIAKAPPPNLDVESFKRRWSQVVNALNAENLYDQRFAPRVQMPTGPRETVSPQQQQGQQPQPDPKEAWRDSVPSLLKMSKDQMIQHAEENGITIPDKAGKLKAMQAIKDHYYRLKLDEIHYGKGVAGKGDILPSEQEPEPPQEPPATASVKMFLTKADIAVLKNLGWNGASINKMKPEEGARIISEGMKGGPPNAQGIRSDQGQVYPGGNAQGQGDGEGGENLERPKSTKPGGEAARQGSAEEVVEAGQATPLEGENPVAIAQQSLKTPLDIAAHEAASSPLNDRKEPSAAQIEADNAKLGHFSFRGIPISIENPIGSVRKDMKNDPPKWQTIMKEAHYGRIKGVRGRDKDLLDVFVRTDNPDSDGEGGGKVFIIDQVNPETGRFDELKVVLGSKDEEQARQTYLANYEEGWQGLGAITEFTMPEFKAWLKNGDATKRVGKKAPKVIRVEGEGGKVELVRQKEDVDLPFAAGLAEQLAERKRLDAERAEKVKEQAEKEKTPPQTSKWKTRVDEGPPGWEAGRMDTTRMDTGMIDPREISLLPGENDEHLLFRSDRTGGYGAVKWREFVNDIKENGVKEPIAVFKEKDGRVHISEGNHRVRAAVEAGLSLVPVEVRYFGNSQRSGLVVDTETGKVVAAPQAQQPPQAPAATPITPSQQRTGPTAETAARKPLKMEGGGVGKVLPGEQAKKAEQGESDQDKSYREFAENYQKVMDDPTKASARDLVRAQAYLQDHVLARINDRIMAGESGLEEVRQSLERELAGLKAQEKLRDGQTKGSQPPSWPSLATSPSPSLTISPLSDKSIIVRGDYAANKDRMAGLLKKYSGLYNAKNKGWVFPVKNEGAVRAALRMEVLDIKDKAEKERPSPVKVEEILSPGLEYKRFVDGLTKEERDLAGGMVVDGPRNPLTQIQAIKDRIAEKRKKPAESKSGFIPPSIPLSEKIRDRTIEKSLKYLSLGQPDETNLMTLERDAAEAMGEIINEKLGSDEDLSRQEADYINSWKKEDFARSVLSYIKRKGLLNKEEPPQSTSTAPASSSLTLANWVKSKITNRTTFTWQELFAQADKAFSGTQSQGAYTPKDAYDAMEMGVNRAILTSNLALNPSSANLQEAEKQIKALQAIINLIPTQSKRTAEMDEFQQFSTPPPLAYLASWVANIQEGTPAEHRSATLLRGDPVIQQDTALEPSAGIGGLAVFAKNAGAKVIVNELSPRRAAILEEMGFDRVFTENAEQLDNVLPPDVKPTVVVMNPPFSSTAGRIKGQRNTMNAARHIEQALNRLEEGGRLVAIVGRGMSVDAPSFRDWFAKIGKKYTVRADIGLSGKGYQKYGTTFDNRLIVIDKAGPGFDNIIKGSVEDVTEALPLLLGVRNARQLSEKRNRSETDQRSKASQGAEPSQTQSGRAQGAQEGQGEPGAVTPSQSSTDDVGAGQQAPRPRQPGKRDGEINEPVEPGRGDEGVVGGDRGGRPGGATPQSEQISGEPGTRADKSGRGKDDSDREAGLRKQQRLEVSMAKAEIQAEALSDSVYDAYKPSVKVAGTKPHPGNLVESAAMASVEAPPVDYVPSIPKEVLSAGNLSDAQMETIVRAGQAHDTLLEGGERQGFFCGDGTGIGKGRIIAGIFLDNWNNGRKKGLWLSANSSLFKDARRDTEGIGDDPEKIFDLGKVKATSSINAPEGILFGTYDTLKMAAKGEQGKSGKRRIDQVVEWLGEDFDGVIAFDESHRAGNALQVQGIRGRKDPSKTALAVIELQDKLPNARVVYVSATGATEVMNLAYAKRLGLWGPGTPFPSVQAFVGQIQSGGIAAMELVSRDMKSMGKYLARSLSFHDVTYDKLEHALTPDQRDIYDKLAEGWQTVLNNLNDALQETGVVDEDGKTLDGRAKSAAMSAFWGSHQRFFNQIITSLQMPSVISRMNKELESGNACVIQLVNTNEASLGRAMANLEEDESLEDLDLTPRDQLMQYIERSFPIFQYEQYEDADGNVKSRPVLDSNGNPVVNRTAEAMKERLLDQLGSIRVPDGPLEMILNEFGVKDVAEVTGRTKRVVTDESGKRVREKRSKAKTETDAQAFQEGKKNILVFSTAGGTGLSYHADLNAKNQKKRIHFLVQAGWRADVAVQGFGRTHRTNQKQAPHYLLVTTDLKGQKRFLSSIARRLDQLGALTKGQRQTGSQGFFNARDNLESEYATEALQKFLKNLLYEGEISGVSVDDFELQTGMKLRNDNGTQAAASPPMTQFLNRLLSFKYDTQNAVFDAFSKEMDAIVRREIENGTLDQGLENLKAAKIELVSEQTVHTDEKSGAETKYVELDVSNPTSVVPWEESGKVARKGYYQNLRSGKVWGRGSDKLRTKSSGDVVNEALLTAPSSRHQNVETVDLDDEKKWRRVEKEEAEKLWSDEYDKAPKMVTQRTHLISGAILPIWDRLTGKARIVRIQTDKGQRFLGRLINREDLANTLRNLGASRTTAEYPTDRAIQLLGQGHRLELSNGWTVKESRVSGEMRIEIVGPNFNFDTELARAGVFTERVNWKTRYFIPVGEGAGAVFEKVVKNRPVVDDVAPFQGSREIAIHDMEGENAKEQQSEQAPTLQGTEAPEITSKIKITNPDEKLAHKAGYSEFFTGVLDIDGGQAAKRVSGKSVKVKGLPEGREAFAYKAEGAGLYPWVVVDKQSGLALASGEKTMENAVFTAEISLENVDKEEMDRVFAESELDLLPLYSERGRGGQGQGRDGEGTGGQGTTNLYSGFPIDELIRELRAVKDMTSSGLEQFLPRLTDLGTRIIARGHNTARTFKAELERVLGGVADGAGGAFDAIRRYVLKIFAAAQRAYAKLPASVTNEVGAVRFRDLPPDIRKKLEGTKVVDEDGKPFVVYHGTLRAFDDYNPSSVGRNTQGSDTQQGTAFFFSDKVNLPNQFASMHGGNVRQEYLNLKNPRIVDLPKHTPNYIAEEIKEARANGNDGLIVKRTKRFEKGLIDTGTIYVAFSPDQIISALSPEGKRTMGQPGQPDQQKQPEQLRATITPTLTPPLQSEQGAIRLPKFPSFPNWSKSQNPRASTGDAEIDAALDKIGPAQKTTKEKLDAALDNWKLKAEQGIFDRFASLKALSKSAGVTDIQEDPYVAATMTTSLGDMLATMMNHGAPQWKEGAVWTATKNKGLVQIFEPVADQLDMFLGWMVGKRAEKLMAEGRENYFTDAEIKALKRIITLPGNRAKFLKVEADYIAFKKKVLDFAESSGVINAEERLLWDHDEYVPFYRIMEETQGLKGPRNKNSVASQYSGIKKLKGGESRLGDIFVNIMMNFSHLVDASVKNHATELSIQAAEKMGVAVKAKNQFKPAIIPGNQIKKIVEAEYGPLLESMGIDTSLLDFKSLQSLYRMFQMTKPQGPDVIHVLRDGKPVYYHIQDPLVLRSLSAVNERPWGGPVLKAMRTAKRLLTRGVTADPGFMIANLARDTLSAWVVSPDFKAGVDSVKGVINTFREDEDYVAMQAAGAAFSGGYAFGHDLEAAKREVEKLNRKYKVDGATVLDSVKKMWAFWEKFGSRFENATRTQIYANIRERGGTHVEAAYEAKRIMDYSKRGDWMTIKFLCETVPFFGARLQGAQRLYHGYRENPRGFATKGAILMGATLALYAMNADDDRYKELEEWDRDNYYHFFLGDQHFRLPKPFEVGAIFSTIPERLAEWWLGEGTSKEFAKRMLFTLNQTFSWQPPQLIGPMIEQYANKSFFTGRPIEGQALQSLQPGARRDPWTGETVSVIGEAMNVSPKRMEAMMRGYFGTLGTYALMASDVVMRWMYDYPDPPASRLDDLPVIRRFIQEDPARHTKYVTSMYEMIREVDQLYATVRRYEKTMEPGKAGELIERERRKLTYKDTFNKVQRQFSMIDQEVRNIHLRRDLTPEMKRKRIDELIKSKNELARDIYENTKAAFK